MRDFIAASASRGFRTGLRVTQSGMMTSAGDPLGSGLIASLARLGGNVTGLSLMAPHIAGKSLQTLKELLPSISRIAVLWNASSAER
jgi:ABC-type uncharacterized transport system substrate-binding protein